MRTQPLATLLALFTIVPLLAGPAHAGAWVATRIEGLGGQDTCVAGVNGTGQVPGMVQDGYRGDLGASAYLHSAGQMIDLVPQSATAGRHSGDHITESGKVLLSTHARGRTGVNRACA